MSQGMVIKGKTADGVAVDVLVDADGKVIISGGGGGGSMAWGTITGTLSNQTDLQTALDAKADASDLTDHISDATDAHNASAISVALTPTHYSPSTADVESHLEGLDAELANKTNNADLPGTIVESVVAGTNVTIDDTDPANPIINASGGGGGGGMTIPPSTSIDTFTGNRLNKAVSGGYTAATYGANGIQTYFEVVGSSSLRQELSKSSRIPVSRLKAIHFTAYVSGYTPAALNQKTFIGYGAVGDSAATSNINENANNIGFTVESVLNQKLRIYALNGNGTTSTKTLIVDYDTIPDGNYPDMTYTLFAYNTGTEIQYYVNGVLATTHTTNLPADTASPVRGWTWLSQKAAGGQYEWLSVDIFESSFSVI